MAIQASISFAAVGVVVVPGLRRDSCGAGAARRGADADHEAAGGGGGGEDEVTAAQR